MRRLLGRREAFVGGLTMAVAGFLVPNARSSAQEETPAAQQGPAATSDAVPAPETARSDAPPAPPSASEFEPQDPEEDVTQPSRLPATRTSPDPTTTEASARNPQIVPSTPRPNSAAAAPILDGDSGRLSFQALLTDTLGDPLPGPTVDLVFNIYAVGGVVPVEGPIAMAGVSIDNGVVDVQIPVSAATFDGSGRELGVAVNAGAELSPRTSLTATPYAFRVNRVASEELDDILELGSVDADGELTLWSNANDVRSIQLDGQAHRISTWGSDGLERVRLWGPSWGEVLLFDTNGNEQTARLSAGPSIIIPPFSDYSEFGGQLRLTDSNGVRQVFLGGDSGRLRLYQSNGTTNGLIADGDRGTALGGEFSVYDADGTQTVEILGAETSTDGSQIKLFTNTGVNTIEIDADSVDAGFISIKDAASITKVFLDVNTGNSSRGEVSVRDGAGVETVEIVGLNPTTAGGRIRVEDATSSYRVQILGEDNVGGGEIEVRDADGTRTVLIEGAEAATQGGQITLYDAAGNATIFIDGDFVGDGRITTQELQITGGSDLSEQFDIRPVDGGLRAGMVVSIDPDHLGELRVSTIAYDRTVAGIVSGAGGVETGMLMGQRGSEADGKHPVALTGRVYCLCDASNGAIQPGDLLTTSNRPGHAMKVKDHARAQGAIIGKAMSPLDGGTGLVLVLVSLQ